MAIEIGELIYLYPYLSNTRVHVLQINSVLEFCTHTLILKLQISLYRTNIFFLLNILHFCELRKHTFFSLHIFSIRCIFVWNIILFVYVWNLQFSHARNLFAYFLFIWSFPRTLISLQRHFRFIFNSVEEIFT